MEGFEDVVERARIEGSECCLVQRKARVDGSGK